MPDQSDPPPGPEDAPRDALSGEGQAFVLRMRLEQAEPGGGTRPGFGTDRDRRLMIRVEHVNRGDVSRHLSVEAALGWLRARMTALLGRPPP